MGRVVRAVLLSVAVATVLLVAMAATLVATGALAPSQPAAAMDAPRFVEEAAAAGIDHAYDGEYPFFVGGGVAVFDCDDDGRADLYFAGGSEPAALYRNESPIGGVLSFRAIPDAATDLTAVTGAYPLDVDGDGLSDLAVLRLGENVLLRGLGDCRFERANEAWGIDGGDALTAAFSARWEGPATLPTLAFGNYVALNESLQSSGTCSESALLRPDSSGTMYGPPIGLAPGYCTLSMLFSDWDRSGRGDLRVSNDRHYNRDGEEQLWRIESGQPPRLYTRDEGWARVRIWGMGIASHDLTGDGLPEVYLTSMGDNKLQTLADGPGRPEYSDIAIRRGVTAHRPFAGGEALPSTAWHAEFQDVNNDGFIDLFVAKGNVEAMPDHASRDPSNLLLGGPDGTFTEGAQEAGVLDYGRARGAALADFNLDGMLDLVRVDRRETVKLWRNVGWGDGVLPADMGAWISLQLEQPGPNRDGIGSWIEVRVGDRTLHREVTVGGGHAGGQLGWVHFGIGTADRAEARVVWPDGEAGPWLGIGAGRFAIIERGATAAQPWLPPQE